jgi:hypothetical protein
MKFDQITTLSNEWAKRFPKRLTGKQKERFLAALARELQVRGFETEQTTLRLWGIPNRLLMTKCANPRMIFLAHYDTPTMMPPGIGIIYKLFGHTRQGLSSLVVILIMLVMYIAYFWLDSFGLYFGATLFLLAIGILFFVPFFFPNPHNREDNTSGVLGLLAIADWIKDKPQIRQHTQFVFLDNEEWGLIGSQALKRHWEKQGYLDSNPLIINLDCVSRGRKPLVIYHKNKGLAQKVLPFLQLHAPQVEILDMKNTPLSDNFTFRALGAIDISLAEPSLIPGGYYIPRVHTPQDDDFSPDNLRTIIEGLTNFLQEQLNTSPRQSPESHI